MVSKVPSCSFRKTKETKKISASCVLGNRRRHQIVLGVGESSRYTRDIPSTRADESDDAHRDDGKTHQHHPQTLLNGYIQAMKAIGGELLLETGV